MDAPEQQSRYPLRDSHPSFRYLSSHKSATLASRCQIWSATKSHRGRLSPSTKLVFPGLAPHGPRLSLVKAQLPLNFTAEFFFHVSVPRNTKEDTTVKNRETWKHLPMKYQNLRHRQILPHNYLHHNHHHLPHAKCHPPPHPSSRHQTSSTWSWKPKN